MSLNQQFFVECLLAVLIVGGALLVAMWKVRQIRNRVWCVCYIEGRVGLVPRSAYDKASREHWKNAKKDECWTCYKYGDTIRILGKQVIVVPGSDPGFHTLTANHFLEDRTFFVPKKLTPFTEAYQRMNGRLP